MSDQFESFARCTTWCRDISTEDQESIPLPIRWSLQERKDEITFWSRAKRVVPLCHEAASGKKNSNTGAVRKSGVALYHGVPPHRFCTCVIFRAVFDLNSSFFGPKPHENPCYAGYRGLTEQCRSVPRGGIKEKNDRSETERAVCLFPSIRYK